MIFCLSVPAPASQLSQSAYYSLQLPFEVFGLGQTPNFVDLLEVGIQNPRNTVSSLLFLYIIYGCVWRRTDPQLRRHGSGHPEPSQQSVVCNFFMLYMSIK